MQTSIAENRLRNPDVRIAEEILRKCVHCGFCNATCPTYQLDGNELEGPRGRIYLIKSLLEDRVKHTAKVVTHLDNCLSCLACETICPSGVRYSHLIDSARRRIEESYRRAPLARLERMLLARLLPYPGRFRAVMRLARIAKPLAPLLPKRLRAMLDMAPARLPTPSRHERGGVFPAEGHRRKRVALLTGCVQKVMGPEINDASIRLLTRLGCEVVVPPGLGCCGALVYHMGNHSDSLPHMRNAIDEWQGALETGGLDHIVINTSGCGQAVRDYGHIFAEDAEYRDKAARIAGLARDLSEVVHELGLPEGLASPSPGMRVAYHDACTLQHGQKVQAQPRALLTAAGFEVLDIPEGHLCCGSAGTYNLLHAETAAKLGQWKAANIAAVKPQLVAAGNIGCMEQIAAHSPFPVVHTAQLLDWATGGPKPPSVP